MSNSRFHNSGKSEFGSTIGFRFHTNDEQLEQLQSDNETSISKISEISEESKTKPGLLTSESLDVPKSDDLKTELMGDVVKDQWNILGRRSTSVDSNYESPFSNPIETWKKLNILKEKITRTVEEKISEMKMDRNVLSKSSKNKLMHSKENSSISDSEDTSDSSKLSELWKDAEDVSSSSNKVSNESVDIDLSNVENPESEITNSDLKNIKIEDELRNRKAPENVLELFKLPDIKIATAKSESKLSSTHGSFEEDDVESGVEADEHLYPTESDSMELEDDSLMLSGSSQRPPSGGRYILYFLKSLASTLLSRVYTAVILIGLTLCYYFPMPEFAKGFICCFILMLFWKAVKSFFYSDEIYSLNCQYKSLKIPDYKSMPPLKVPEHKPVKGVWVNEYEKELYDPDYYSVSQTVPAFLELEGSILKLSRPKGKINKRATFDEPEYKFHFISQRKYDISGCNVFLMPEGLTRKRLYSKKYPIVIFLRPNSAIFEKRGTLTDVKENKDEDCEVLEKFKNKSSLYLFARCDRQKEEWYRRLLTATRLSQSNKLIKEASTDIMQKPDESPVKEPSTPFENLIFEDEISQLDEYFQYMVKFVDLEVIHEEKIKHYIRKHRTKKKDFPGFEDKLNHQTTSKIPPETICTNEKSGENEEKMKEKMSVNGPELQLQWFNAFVNRILFDVFRSPYWLSKIHDKVQRKLNSIRLPYYVEEIEVIEMDLGKTGPVFHRVSQPYLDERGLWFDMDTTFDGFIRLTIQTHLNLIKLQKGFEEENGASNANEKLGKEKTEQKEVKETSEIRESSEVKEENHPKVRKLHKVCLASCSKKAEEPSHSDHRTSSDTHLCECDNLIHEVAQLAEMAIEESLKPENQNNLKPDSECPCSRKTRSAIYDSDLEDSAESSDEEEEEEDHPPPPPTPPQPTVPEEYQQPISKARRYPKNRRSSKRLFRVFENVAQSKYFKSMAQSKYIQRAIAGVSAAKLRLTLEIKSLTGILTINIPPPPSDRFWYGFREMPTLVFSANPKIGEKAVRFVHIKNYLQRKILHELKKVMVEPNMIDFVLPTSPPTRSSTSTEIEPQELQEQEETPTEV